ncbi:unnamed protein product [Nippostrongylus brasiliensis]|uniref:SGNH domain-containing protein n=1 Tax=Nippostrongylus brasiliensis TaxID=27835 RepID=A0A0N4XZN6_NIPBR|nr:unnamed protein product [Nippostrongylus brasiliensis]
MKTAYSGSLHQAKWQIVVDFLSILALLVGNLWSFPFDSTKLRLTTTLTTAVVVAFGNNLLSSRCLVHFGDISYTLYLVHWPIFCWLKLNFKSRSYGWSSGDLIAGVILAWLLSVLLTQTYERWYRAANKSTILVMVVALYALTGTTILLSDNLRVFVAALNPLTDGNLTTEETYINITLDNAIRINNKFTVPTWKDHYNDLCEFVKGGPHWWCTFKDKNESASSSVLIIGNCWAANHAPVIHERCKHHAKSITLYSYPACDIVVEHQASYCNGTFDDYINFIAKMKPDYLFVIAKQIALPKKERELNSSEQDAYVEQIYARTESLQNVVKKRLFILDALPRTIPDYIAILNSKLSKQQLINQTELVDQVAVEFIRSALRQVISSCGKCSLISYDKVFGRGSSFRVFDEKTKVSFFTGHYISPFGLRKVASIYDKICSSF